MKGGEWLSGCEEVKEGNHDLCKGRRGDFPGKQAKGSRG